MTNPGKRLCLYAGPTLVAVALLTMASPALAQPSMASASGIGGGHFQVGFMSLDLDALNSNLNDAGYPSLDSRFVTIGGGGFGSRGRFLFGGEGHGLRENSETTSDGAFEITAGGGYGLFQVGYMAYSDRGLDIFPLVGIGGGGLSVSITGRSAPLFDDVLDEPARSSRLSTGGFLINLALRANYRMDLTPDGVPGGGLLFGVQAGYTLQPGTSSWELDGINNVAGGPDFQIEGFHLRISIGGWGEQPPREAEGPGATATGSGTAR